jgi:hypothetical protein
MQRLALKMQDFEQIFCCWKTVPNKSGSGIGTGTGAGTETGTGAGTETGAGNKSLRIHNTALQRLPVTGKLLVSKKIVEKEFLVWGLGSLR